MSQLTPEPIGSAITVLRASPATYRQADHKPRIIDRASPSLPFERQPRPANQPRPPPSQAAASGQQWPRAAGSWADVPPNKRRLLRGEGEACDSGKHLFTKDGCFLPTPQLTPEPTGSAVTVSHVFDQGFSNFFGPSDAFGLNAPLD